MTDVKTTADTSPSAAAVAVTLDAVNLSFAGHRALRDFSLDIVPGEFITLLGPSGSGKTTALRVLAGLETPDAGTVSIGGRDVTAVPTNKRGLGMVFQSYSLFPHLSALANVEYGLRIRKEPRAQARRKALEALELVGLSEFANRLPHELSGGQQQRVAVARAVVTEPAVLLLDESLSALDAQVRVQLRSELRQIQRRLGITTVFVTHDQEEALSIADRVVVMRDGKVEQIGTPEELYLSPATDFVAEFIGHSNTVPATRNAAGVIQVLGREVSLESAPEQETFSVYVRPEDLAFSDSGVPATVRESTFLGSHRRTLVTTHDGELLLSVQHPATQVLTAGQGVRVSLDSPRVVLRKAE